MPFDARVRLLLVEDDPDDHLIAKTLLRDIPGWEPEVDWASTYEEGLRMVGDVHYDVALVDYQLGARTGIDFLGEERLRATGTPVIILTGHGGREVDLEATRAGAVDYLRKAELTSEALERSIRYAVEARRRNRLEAHFRALIERGRDLITVMDPDGTARYVSPSLVRILGFEPEEVVGTDLMQEVHPEDRPRIREAFERLVDGSEETQELRYRVRHRDGSWTVLDTVARNLIDDPLIRGVVVNSWDVTELHRTESELLQQRADLRERVKELRCLYRVQRALHHIDVGVEAALQGVVDAIPPGFHYPDRMAARVRVVGRTFETEGFRETPWCLEAPIRSGESRIGDVQVCFVEDPPEPDAPFLPEERPLVEAIADRVGEALARHRAEEELEASEAFHRALIERSGLAVAVVDRDGTVRHVSGEVEGVLGRAPDELRGRNVTELVTPGDRDRLRGLVEDCVRDGIHDAVARVDGVDGTSREVEFNARSLLDEDAVGGIVVTARDVTERRRRERQIRFQAELLDRVGQPVFATDDRGRVTYWNRAAERVLGWTREEMLGASFVERMVPPELEERARRIREHVGTGGSWEGEIPLVRKDGERVIVQGSVTVSRDAHGEPVGRIAAGADITELRRAEAALREQKELLASVAADAPVILFALDTDGRIRLSEGRGLERIGVEPGGLVGINLFEMYADRPDLRDDVRRALDGERFRVVRRVYGRVLETWWSPLTGVGGTVGISLDITERHEAQKRQERLTALIEATPDFVGIADPTGDVLFLNRAARRMVGLGDDEELDGLRIDDLHPEWALERLEEEAIPSAIREGSWSGEAALLDAEGGEVPLWQVVIAHRSEEGEVDFLSTVARDVTERNRAARRIRFQADLLDAVGQAVMATDLDGTVTYWNRGAEELYGWRREEALGRDILDVTPSDLTREEAAEIMERLRAGESWTGEFEVQRKDGTRFPALVTDAPIRDPDGGLVGVVGVSQDLTERKALEEELRHAQKMEAIGRLAGGVAHDFNNLLTAIQGHADLLLQDLDPASPLRDEVRYIRTAGERAADLTRQLLAFSRKQVLEDRLLDLRRVVRDMEPMLRRLIPTSVGIRFDTPEEPVPVRADPGQLQQVVLNLAVNGGDAMGDQGVLSIDVDTTTLSPADADDIPWEAHPGPYVRLTVSDTGTGIPPDVMRHIFEPFYTTKGEGKGTGLGLSTVFGIVKQSGGHIFVESQPGEGTTFRVLLPRAEGAIEEEGEAEDVPRAEDGERGRATVLLVEDDAAVRRFGRRVLERAGYEVLEARNGREAMEIAGASAGAVNLVVSDVVMPEMGGTRLTDLLREHYPGLRVVLTSGYSEEELAGDVRGRSEAFLGKPFSPDDLIRVVSEILAEGT